MILNTAIRGEQIVESTISGAHIINAAIKPIKLDIINLPEDGDVLTYNSSSDNFEWEKIGVMIANETPTGAINGTNKVYTLSETPRSNSLEVYLNGILQQPGVGNDYTVSGTTLTFTTAPEIGDIILCSYLTSGGLGGGYYTDHGNLNGLLDDDHPQYILVNGSRAFTDIVNYSSHPTFTSDTNLVDKKYVDDELNNVSVSQIVSHDSYVSVSQTAGQSDGEIDFVTNFIDIGKFEENQIWLGNTGGASLYLKNSPDQAELDINSIRKLLITTSSLTTSVDILPDMTNASGSVSIYNIGSSSAKFNSIYCHDLYADAGSIYVNDKKVIEDVSDVITISTDSGQRLKVATTGDSGDVYISGEGGLQLVVPSTFSNHDITISNNSSGGDINIGGTGQSIKLNGVVDLTNGTIDHGDLTGLADDDHTQYILADGSRAFSGAVSGITPTSGNHLATKSYVDSKVQGLDWQDSVKDKDLTAPLGSPANGDRYLVASGATGDWSGHDGDLAEWNGSSWDFTVKNEGMAVWVEDEDKLYTYNGSSWVIFGSTISHNSTSGLNDGDYKHLTATEYNGLTGGSNTSLHLHDDRYYTESEADSRFVNVSGDTMTGTLRINGTTKSAGYLYAGTTDPTNSTRLNYDGYFYATKVYNAIYNDIADFQKIDDIIKPGKCYFDTYGGAKICNERCQLGVIGILSDTYGFGVGACGAEGFAPIAIAGWVLAYVDKEYVPGTPLTNNENGDLTEMTLEEKQMYPERLVAIYKKKEESEYWGPHNIKVDGRHWVKVK